MRLATIRVAGGTRAVRIDGGQAVETGHSDVGALLAAPDWRDQAAAASGEQHPASSLDLAPVVPRPGKVVCVGLNYRNHILEMGRELPEYPTLFAKFADAFIGPRDPIQLAPESSAVDWEAELAVVVGGTVRRVLRAQRCHHAGLAVPHHPVAAGQDLRGDDPDRPGPGDAGRAARRRPPRAAAHRHGGR
jgi:2-keto-4-pentenoate hydratase/2-oxohepta-3-ene-1,7-dioic acid hydratase in catechol pathway